MILLTIFCQLVLWLPIAVLKHSTQHVIDDGTIKTHKLVLLINKIATIFGIAVSILMLYIIYLHSITYTM